MSTSSPTLTEARTLLRLAVPIAAVNVGNILLGVVDSAFVGRLGERALGAVGLGGGVYFVISTLGLGLMLGLDPLITQAVGAGERRQSRVFLWQGYIIALLVTVPLALFTIVTTVNLEAGGINPLTASATEGYVYARLPSLIPFLMLSGSRSFLQAHSVVRPLVIGVVVANILNVPANGLLVFGDAGLQSWGLPAIGLPQLGATGAGLASTISMVVQLLVALAAIRRLPGAEISVGRAPDWALIKRTVRLGSPIAGMLFAEVGIFVLIAFFMGILGDRELAAHQVAITLASGTFVVALGIGMAATVRVGQAVGRGDGPGARRAGFTAMAMSGLFMTVCAIAFLIAPELLASIITTKEHVIREAVPLLFIAAIFQVSDGIQATAAGALRGAGDVKWPFFTNVFAHYAVGLPLALTLTFVLGLGAPGLWWGLVAGLSVVAIGLVTRFWTLTGGDIERVA